MTRPTVTRVLRITWTVAWGVVALLLVALWVRSYRSTDIVVGQCFTISTDITINRGSVTLLNNRLAGPSLFVWRIRTLPPQPLPTGGLHWQTFPSLHLVQVPIPILLALVATASTLSWIRWSHRFSLRTLLLALTAVAVLLGLVVWAVG